MDNLILTTLTKAELENFIYSSIKSAFESQNLANNSEIITIDELAKRLNRSKTSIWQWRKDGLIPFRRIKRKVYFDWQEVVKSLHKIDIKKLPNSEASLKTRRQND